MINFNETLLAELHAEGFDIATITPANDNFAAWQELGETILANNEDLQTQLPLWYCRGMCFAQYLQCVLSGGDGGWNGWFCRSRWEACIQNCNPE